MFLEMLVITGSASVNFLQVVVLHKEQLREAVVLLVGLLVVVPQTIQPLLLLVPAVQVLVHEFAVVFVLLLVVLSVARQTEGRVVAKITLGGD
jgi:hypothetical protein